VERYLGSGALQLKSENDAFTLVLGWSEGLSYKDRKEAWARLIPQLRFDHMSLDFLGGVVGNRKHDAYAPQLRERVMSAICFKALKPKTSRIASPNLKDVEGLLGEKDRAGDGQLIYEFKAHFELQDCLALTTGSPSKMTKLGIARGFPITLEMQQTDKGHLGLFVSVSRPGAARLVDASVAASCKVARLKIEAGGRMRHGSSYSRLCPGVIPTSSVAPGARWSARAANSSPTAASRSRSSCSSSAMTSSPTSWPRTSREEGSEASLL
jgi:hypothetical protein